MELDIQLVETEEEKTFFITIDIHLIIFYKSVLSKHIMKPHSCTNVFSQFIKNVYSSRNK